MNQNSIIFGALFVGFLIYITIRGRLPAYVSVFWAKSAQGQIPLTISPSLGLVNPVTPSGSAMPYIGFTPNTPNLGIGIPGA